MPLCSFLLSQCTRRCQVTDGCASPWPSHKYQAHEKAAYWSPPPSGCLAIFPCSSHSLCQNEWGIIHVGVSVCGAGQQDLGMAKAGCAETPKPFLVVRLPSETERLACHMHLRIVPGRPSLAEAPKGDVFCGEAYVMLALKILGRKEKESIT